MTEPRTTAASLEEILSRIRALQEESPSKIPLIDPTANVLSLVTAAMARQDDLRLAETRRIDDLLTERRQTDSDAKRAEAARIDALLAANKNDVALALAKQQAQAEAQDKRIAIVEQNQYQGVGATGQRVLGRQSSQWIIGLLVFAAIGVTGLLLRLVK